MTIGTVESDETSSLIPRRPNQQQQPQQQTQEQQLQSHDHPQISPRRQEHVEETDRVNTSGIRNNSLLDSDGDGDGDDDDYDNFEQHDHTNVGNRIDTGRRGRRRGGGRQEELTWSNFATYGTVTDDSYGHNEQRHSPEQTQRQGDDGPTTSTDEHGEGQHHQRQQQEQRRQQSDEDNDTRESQNNRNRGDGGEADEGSEAGGGEGSETRDGAIGTLTRRLRCLFSTITWPIVPLGTIVALALLWVLYAASSLDLRKSCSHPMHWYAVASLILVAYIPNHATIRSHLFQYSRERDGPIRPARVRMYDQFFHTICLLYVYTGVTLIQTCREDIVTGDDAAAAAQETMEANGNDFAIPSDGPINTCQATCPNLYQALSVYVATLEMFTFALILPLLFLPCIYLWFLRRATAEAEAFAHLQERLQEEEALLNNNGVTVGQILDTMQTVKLVSRKQPSNVSANRTVTETLSPTERAASTDENDRALDEELMEEDEVWLLPFSATAASVGMKSDVKECCICMNDFEIRNEADLEDGLLEESGVDSVLPDDSRTSDYRECNSDSSEQSTDHSSVSSEAAASVKPICCKTGKDSVIVRTKCGHIFHQECLIGWIGGRWQLNPNSADATSDENNSHLIRRRRARQTCCPLCREDLRPTIAT